MKRKYDGQLKLIYNLGMERMLVSESLRKSIPKSTASTWRSLSVDSILQGEYNEEIRKNLLFFIDMRKQIYKRDRITLFTLVRMNNLIKEALGHKEYRNLLRKNKKHLFDELASQKLIKSI
jgi:hypothetical protein